jgi:hypothetical protein
MNSAPVTTLPDVALVPMLPLGDMVTLIFYIVLALYVVFTGVLYYHWSTYANNKAVALTTHLVYFAITIPLMLTIAGAALLM